MAWVDTVSETFVARHDERDEADAERVLSQLADADGDITLVIDDLHELNCPEALNQLTSLLTNLPPRVHAVLAMRHDLPGTSDERKRLDGHAASLSRLLLSPLGSFLQ